MHSNKRLHVEIKLNSLAEIRRYLFNFGTGVPKNQRCRNFRRNTVCHVHLDTPTYGITYGTATVYVQKRYDMVIDVTTRIMVIDVTTRIMVIDVTTRIKCVWNAFTTDSIVLGRFYFQFDTTFRSTCTKFKVEIRSMHSTQSIITITHFKRAQTA